MNSVAGDHKGPRHSAHLFLRLPCIHFRQHIIGEAGPSLIGRVPERRQRTGAGWIRLRSDRTALY